MMRKCNLNDKSGDITLFLIDNSVTIVIEYERDKEIISVLLSQTILLLYIRSDTIGDYVLTSIKGL